MAKIADEFWSPNGVKNSMCLQSIAALNSLSFVLLFTAVVLSLDWGSDGLTVVLFLLLLRCQLSDCLRPWIVHHQFRCPLFPGCDQFLLIDVIRLGFSGL